MRGMILSQINSNDFDLKEMIDRINYFCVAGEITVEDREDLIARARTKALASRHEDPEIVALWIAIHDIQAQLGSNKKGSSDGYPEYKQPTGAHDAYYTGNGMTFDGKQYRCKMDYCIWSPDIYPNGWEEVK